MPEEGIDFAKRSQLLSFDEMYRLSALFVGLGVDKIRITGGEPFVRNGIIPFLNKLSKLDGLNEIVITSNGTLTTQHQAALKNMGISKINISLDSLNAERFHYITRRDSFDTVYNGIMQMLDNGFDIKLNCVVAENKNIRDIIPFIELTKDHQITVRFLEEMPFNGTETSGYTGWDHTRIYNHIAANYSHINKITSEANSTSVNYQIASYKGSFGIIPSFSRTFCGTCNRIRLSATGELRTCLYGAPAANLRDLARSGASGEELEQIILNAVAKRERDGFAAEAASRQSIHTSMSVLGG